MAKELFNNKKNTNKIEASESEVEEKKEEGIEEIVMTPV